MKYQNCHSRTGGNPINNIIFRRIITVCFWLITYHLSLITPAYAEVRIGEEFGFGQLTSLGQTIGQLVPTGFSVAAAMVIIYFLWGAFNWLKSGGNKEEVAAARQTITHAIIGFIILMFAFFIIQFIPQFLNLQDLFIVK